MEAWAGIVAIVDVEIFVDVEVVGQSSSREKFEKIISGFEVEATNDASEPLGQNEIDLGWEGSRAPVTTSRKYPFTYRYIKTTPERERG